MEYIGLSHSQKTYGKKNLLYCEMELLSSIKRYNKYKTFRKQENALKNLLKKKIEEVQEEISNLVKLLPKTKENEKIIDIRKQPKKRSDLETEIDDIRRQIEELENQ